MPIRFPDEEPVEKQEPILAGDRVKLIGNHKYAGYIGKVCVERKATPSGSLPMVEVDLQHGERVIVVVVDAERQMRKI
jgi:hypothetical protein